VTVHDPICTDDGNLEAALYGSFFPVPTYEQAQQLFPLDPPEAYNRANAPGSIVVKPKSPITINKGRKKVCLRVTNNGECVLSACRRSRGMSTNILTVLSRPIQVGSHYHFIETNPKLSFDRLKAYGKRLDIPSGTAVRFEPGDCKTVTLVEIGGSRRITGGNNLASGDVSEDNLQSILEEVIRREFAHVEEPGAREIDQDRTMTRESYAAMFGPTTGDRVRLGDTTLWIEVEDDLTIYGDECKFGGGKVIREGMGQATDRSSTDTLDLLITNALIIDHSGIFKADVGVCKGHIVALGKAGNPDVMPGVHPQLVVGSSTEVIAGEGLILTAGAVDAHVHYICPQQVEEALASGTTTMIGGGTGPSAGTCATTCTSSPWYIEQMFKAFDGLPMNFAVTGKGNDAGETAMIEIIKAGAAGLKLHEVRVFPCLRLNIAELSATGLGFNPFSYRYRFDCRREVRRSSQHSHRYAQRIWIC